MSDTATITLLWLGFASFHLAGTSARVRPRSIARLGEDVHRLLFSLVALSFAVPTVALAFRGRADAAQWWSFPASLPLEIAVYAGLGCAVVLMVLSGVHRPPTNLAGGSAELRGVLRVTRQPLMMGLALFGSLFLLQSGRSTDVVFFGGLAAFALIGGWQQDRRYLREDPSYRAFYEATSFLPFGPRGRSAPRGGSDSQDRTTEQPRTRSAVAGSSA